MLKDNTLNISLRTANTDTSKPANITKSGVLKAEKESGDLRFCVQIWLSSLT